jgi:hypothetical protein
MLIIYNGAHLQTHMDMKMGKIEAKHEEDGGMRRRKWLLE